MLLLLLLAVGPPSPATTPLLSIYYRAAVEYRVGDREKALREIRRWGPREVRECIQALREEGDRQRKVVLRAGEVVDLPAEIDFGAAEAAALMHVEVGLQRLRSLEVTKAESHLAAAASLVEWSHESQAKRLELLAKLRRGHDSTEEFDHARSEELERALSFELRIDPRAFYVALAAAALNVGFPEAALPFAEKAQAAAPLDGDALLLCACVKETLATAEELNAHRQKARRLRGEAEALLRETLAADPGRVEARLRLGGVLLAQGRPREAEPELRQAAELAQDGRQRYLALLFLGRASEQPGSPGDSAALYRRALAAWPESQAARLALARSLEATAGPDAARAVVLDSLLDSRRPARPPDPWWSYPFGPHGMAKNLMELLWQTTLGRSFPS